MSAKESYEKFTQEMEVRDAIDEVINLVDDLDSDEAKKDSLEYAIKMLQEQLNDLK